MTLSSWFLILTLFVSWGECKAIKTESDKTSIGVLMYILRTYVKHNISRMVLVMKLERPNYISNTYSTTPIVHMVLIRTYFSQSIFVYVRMKTLSTIKYWLRCREFGKMATNNSYTHVQFDTSIVSNLCRTDVMWCDTNRFEHACVPLLYSFSCFFFECNREVLWLNCIIDMHQEHVII